MTRSARRAAQRREAKPSSAFAVVPALASSLPKSEIALQCLTRGDAAQAEALAKEALVATPNDAIARQILGAIAYQRQEFREACDIFAQVVELDPLNKDAHNNLAESLRRAMRFDDALPIFKRALELTPDNHDTGVNYAHILIERGQYTEAIAAARKVLESHPDSVAALQNLSLALWAAGYVAEGIEAIREAIARAPKSSLAWGNLLMYLQYSAVHSEEELLEAARAWGATVDAKPVVRPVDRAGEPARLRIGYVSGDLRDHPVGFQIEKVLAEHDRTRVEIVLYSTSPEAAEDVVTPRLKALADGWRNLTELDDEAAARQIAEDHVHVLVDLSGHTAKNRLGIFAHHPAPVQTTWLGYFATTGLSQMDFMLRDRAQIPLEEERFYTERIWPIENASFGYVPPEGCPDVSPLPALAKSTVTFGCFNNAAKISDLSIRAWARVLHRIPGSRMILDRKGLDDPIGRDRILATFARHGIGPERLDLGASMGRAAYLARYAEVDVVLDTFPFNGATTTYEALWMGVPVVGHRWSRMVGHFAESILDLCGRSDWVASDEDGYVEKAVALVNDLEGLATLRAGLRSEFAASRACQAGDCASGLERAYEGMWRAVRGPATAVAPREIEAYQMIGVAALQEGNVDLAERIFRRTTELAPNLAEGFGNLGVILLRGKRVGESILCFERAVALDPNHAVTQGNLGEALAFHGRMEEAVSHLERAIALRPDVAHYRFGLVSALASLGRFAEAFAAFERGSELDPKAVEERGASLFGQLGDAFATYSRFDEAFVCMIESAKYETGITDPLTLQYRACLSLGSSMQHAGRIDEAIEWFAKAIEILPNDPQAQGGLSWCLQYSDRFTGKGAFDWASQQAQRYASHTLARRPKPNLSGPRKLRVGYLSPDFRDNPVGYLIETLLKAHRREEFEFYLYANVQTPDALSKRIRNLADGWRDISNLSDAAAADLIERDGIDVLIDLAGYTAGHRIGVFAHKPAPVQAQWLGYYATSGLPQMDYIVVNPKLIPSEEEAFYVEKPMRVEGRAFCFEPPCVDLPVPPSPALERGVVTFGSNNYLGKVTPEVIRVWAETIKAVPGSRMRLNRQAFVSHATRERFLAAFESHGVDRSRIDLLSTFSRDEHLATLGEFDIMLDTFPFNGGTSIYEALWMGLPVVTMSAPRMVGHFGESILEPLGYGEWVAQDAKEYVAKAAALASDLPRLSEIRAGLRDRLVNSPLCDAVAYTREIEDAFRRMWSEKTQGLAAAA